MPLFKLPRETNDKQIFPEGIYKNEEILEEFSKNFAVKGPIMLEFREGDVDLLATSEKIFRHYAGTTHITLSHADAVNEVSCVLSVFVKL